MTTLQKKPVLIAIHPSGQVVWGQTPPKGTLVIASASRYQAARTIVEVRARHAYDGKRYLCPGVPEADSGEAAMAAAIGWRDWICRGYPDDLTPIDPPYVAGAPAGGAA